MGTLLLAKKSGKQEYFFLRPYLAVFTYEAKPLYVHIKRTNKSICRGDIHWRVMAFSTTRYTFMGGGGKDYPSKVFVFASGKKKICRAMLFMILTFCASHSQFLRPCTECIQIMVRMLSLHFDSAYKYSKNRCSLETRSPRAASDFALDILLWYCSYSGGCPKSDGEYILWFKLGNSCDIHSAKEPEVPKAGRCVGLFIVDLLGLWAIS